jgi:hypothetical protein
MPPKTRGILLQHSNETNTITSQGDDGTCLYHTIARLYLNNVFKLNTNITSETIRAFFDTDASGFGSRPDLLKIPPLGTPEYDEYIKACMFLYIFYIIRDFYTICIEDPGFHHVPLLFKIINANISNKVVEVDINGSIYSLSPFIPHELKKHERHIRDFLRSYGVDVAKIRLMAKTFRGTIRSFGENVMVPNPGEYFGVYIDGLTRSIDGHAIVLSKYNPDKATFTIKNSWDESMYGVPATMLSLGCWSDTVMTKEKWGFFDYVIYIGLKKITYESKGDTPIQLFRKRFTAAMVGAAFIAFLYGTYQQYKAGLLASGASRKRRKRKQKKSKRKV